MAGRHRLGRAGEAHGARPARGLIAWLSLGLAVAAVLVLTGTSHRASSPSVAGRRSDPPAHVRTGRTDADADLPSELARRALLDATIAGEATPSPPTATAPATEGSVTSSPSPPPTTIPSTTTIPGKTSTSTTASTSTSTSTTTSTTTIPSTTSTTTPVLAPASVVESDVWNGVLTFPNDVASSFAFTSRDGPLTATATFSAGAALEVVIRCGTQIARAEGASPVVVDLAVAHPHCDWSIALPAGDSTRTRYRIEIVHRSAPPEGT